MDECANGRSNVASRWSLLAFLHLAFKRKLIKKKKKKISHSHFISFDGEDSLTDASIKLGKYFTTTFGAIRP